MIETPRLLLRPWRESDMPLFAEQNADPAVMQYLTGVLSREASDAYARRAQQHFADHGFCKWAVEAPGVAPFIGAVGLSHVAIEASFTPPSKSHGVSTGATGAAATRPKRRKRRLTMGSTGSDCRRLSP